MNKLAIAIPTYNEKENIENLIESIKSVLSSVNIHTTLIIIDDNSPDGTGKLIDDLSQKYKSSNFRIHVMHRPKKMGLSSAYIGAFKYALKQNFDFVLTMDADFSHQPKYIPEFLEKIKTYDVVAGSRYVKGGSVENWNLLRRVISKGGSLYSRIILGVNIKDFTGGFNMYRRKVLETLNLDAIKSEGYSYQIEMKYKIAKSEFSYIESPIIFPDRKLGKAKMSKKIVFEAFLRVWQIKFSKQL